uniref:Tetratricopeptide repeat protein 39B n=1 Tax=Plectus sambesii TaxID=2011161 RepID=A0A914VPI5_9BILA
MMKKIGLAGKMSPNAAAVANGVIKREPSNMSCATTDSDDVCFQDAMEDIPTSSSMDLYESIRETQIALSLFLNNRFDEARARMEPLASQSMYHALGYSTIIYIRAMMTCEREDIEKAMKVTKDACSVCDRFRYRWTLTDTVTSRIVGGSQRILTDEEMHAELCYAECLLLRALLTFVQDENLSSFVKGAMKIRSCYQSYRECQRILHAQQWNDRDPMVRAHFESGTRMGVGTFNLMISTLPSRILKLLEFVGFSGDKVSRNFLFLAFQISL